MTGQRLLEVQGLGKDFHLDSDRVLHACQDVSFTVDAGSTLGIIGESGSGKTTLGRCLLRLVEPSCGSIKLGGLELTKLPPRKMRSVRQRVRIVFQEPTLSMNPQLSVGYQIADPLRIHTKLTRAQRKVRAGELLESVGLSARMVNAYPAGLSGGELQRCSIARALASSPELIVLDEPTSALPPATRRDIIELLKRLQVETNVAYVFISHDLSLVRSFCDQVAVMYLGRIVEQSTTAQLFESPAHPYTAALLAAQLAVDPDARSSARSGRLIGEIPSAIDLPRGCSLASRCPHVVTRCQDEDQPLQNVGRDHLAACWRVAEGDIHLAGRSSRV